MSYRSVIEARERLRLAAERYRAMYDFLKTLLDGADQPERYLLTGGPGLTGRSAREDCYLICVNDGGVTLMSILFLGTGDIKLWRRERHQGFCAGVCGLAKCQIAAQAHMKELVPCQA